MVHLHLNFALWYLFLSGDQFENIKQTNQLHFTSWGTTANGEVLICEQWEQQLLCHNVCMNQSADCDLWCWCHLLLFLLASGTWIAHYSTGQLQNSECIMNLGMMQIQELVFVGQHPWRWAASLECCVLCCRNKNNLGSLMYIFTIVCVPMHCFWIIETSGEIRCMGESGKVSSTCSKVTIRINKQPKQCYNWASRPQSHEASHSNTHLDFTFSVFLDGERNVDSAVEL